MNMYPSSPFPHLLSEHFRIWVQFLLDNERYFFKCGLQLPLLQQCLLQNHQTQGPQSPVALDLLVLMPTLRTSLSAAQTDTVPARQQCTEKQQGRKSELCLSLCKDLSQPALLPVPTQWLPWVLACAEGKCSTPMKWRQIRQWIKGWKFPTDPVSVFRVAVWKSRTSQWLAAGLRCSTKWSHSEARDGTRLGSCYRDLFFTITWCWMHGLYLLPMSQRAQRPSHWQKGLLPFKEAGGTNRRWG